MAIKHSSLWVGVLGFKWSGGKKRRHCRMGGYTLGKMKNLHLTVSTSSLCSEGGGELPNESAMEYAYRRQRRRWTIGRILGQCTRVCEGQQERGGDVWNRQR